MSRRFTKEEPVFVVQIGKEWKRQVSRVYAQDGSRNEHVLLLA